MIQRRYSDLIRRAFRVHPVVGLLGPRQCGKTTTARQFIKDTAQGASVHYFDLEDPSHLAQLESPELVLNRLKGLVVIDEVQKIPDLFPLIRVLVDRPSPRVQFLILGSASRDLIRQGSETLAGRIQFLELSPFSLTEVGTANQTTLWLRGGFPRSFLAPTLQDSAAWRRSFVSSYLERDIPALGFQIPASHLRRFWMMLVHYHGQLFNASELGRSLGVADTTARRYLDILSGTFMVRSLSPWTENIAKRQVRSMKIFFRDAGLFHTLLGVQTEKELYHHPKLGASWEGFAVEEVIRCLGASSEECYFWATHGEAELDLLVFKGTKRLGFEIKHSLTPRLTPSMRIAQKDLALDSLTVITPGEGTFPLGRGIDAVGLSTFLTEKGRV